MVMIVIFLSMLLLLSLYWILRSSKKAPKVEYKQKPLIHVLEEGILVLNSVYQVVECNKVLCRLLGCRAADLIDQDFFSLSAEMHIEVVQKCQELLKELGDAQGESRTSLSYNRGSEMCSVDILAARLNANEYVLVLKDTSDEYETFRTGKDFIANASHELRTPITIIKGFIETLQDLPEVSDAMLEDIFEKILRSCRRMEDIVRNLLLLTDLDHCFKTNTQKVDMIALLDNCRHSLLEIYPDVSVEMRCAQEARDQEVDSSLLELAIMNLLQNAVKYSPVPAKIEIELKENAGECLINIIDQGCGISKENRPHIFNRFYSVNKTVSRRLGGAGLGLSIVKNIVEKHQGSITVEDNPAGGSVFTLAIPNH